MGYQFTPLMTLYALIFLLTFGLGIYAVRRYLRRDRRLSVFAFATLMFGFSFWEITNFVAAAVVRSELTLIVKNVTNAVVIPFVCFGTLFFAFSFADKRRWIRWAAVVSAVQLVGLSVLLAFDPVFLYEPRGLTVRGPITVLGVTVEQWVLLDRDLNLSFALHQLYIYAVTLFGAGVVLPYIATNNTDDTTSQAVLMAVGFGTPLVVNALLLAGIIPPHLNVTDLGLGLTAVALAVAIFRYQLFQVAPIGRQQLFDVMDDPVVLVDHNNRVVDSNPTARRVFEVDSEWRGMHETAFLGGFAETLRSVRDTDETEPEPLRYTDDAGRCFDAKTTAVGDGGSRLITFRDITTLEATRRDLEQSNERLDAFASIVSHELRNPLNVAMIQTNRLDVEPSDDAERLEDALDRMESMIDSMLELARAGEDVEQTETCSLAEHAEQSWNHVQTGESELDCRVGDTAIEADPVRLLQLFQNLFENATAHNDGPLTVLVGTVGTDSNTVTDEDSVGFFVADDGDGIPEDERDAIFEHGHTTSNDSTGYGLTIVRYIAEAHDWSIRVADGIDGGIRIEITDVTASRPQSEHST